VTVRVVVADDSELLRAGLVTVLSSHPDIEVVAEAANGVEAAEFARQLAPDVVLMDIEMPGGDGITATRSIVSDCADTRVLVLTMFDLDDYVLEALRAGASGFLLKTSPPQPLIQSVLTCAAGHATLDASVMRLIGDRPCQIGPPRAGPRHG
jgi:DNA-binding NarL/FixJ family response regulator